LAGRTVECRGLQRGNRRLHELLDRLAGIAAVLVFAWAAGLGHFAALGVGAATPQAVAIGGLLAIFGAWPFLWRASEARPAPALSAAAAVAGAAALISIPLI
ncbi:hypothetical protein, partial [Maribellus luteus]|uniref:hypothetical protein n=1 Tax=Maribellus luteus TaxID=2305463 RepID=UPI0019D46EEF